MDFRRKTIKKLRKSNRERDWSTWNLLSFNHSIYKIILTCPDQDLNQMQVDVLIWKINLLKFFF